MYNMWWSRVHAIIVINWPFIKPNDYISTAKFLIDHFDVAWSILDDNGAERYPFPVSFFVSFGCSIIASAADLRSQYKPFFNRLYRFNIIIILFIKYYDSSPYNRHYSKYKYVRLMHYSIETLIRKRFCTRLEIVNIHFENMHSNYTYTSN